MMMFAASVALTCSLHAQDPTPPMFLTLNDDTKTVQVTMAGQTYLEDYVGDQTVIFWQRGAGDKAIRSRLNRADGTLIITNNGMMVDAICTVAKRKF